jgi:hypothetical protein
MCISNQTGATLAHVGVFQRGKKLKAGTYGDANHVPRITVNSKGVITAIELVPIVGQPGPAGPVGPQGPQGIPGVCPPAGEYVLPEGANWSKFMAGYNSVDPGDILRLPADADIIEESSLFVQKPIQILRSSPLSGLRTMGNLNLSGGAQQIAIGYGGNGSPFVPVDGVVLDFNIEHTRGFNNRMIAISIFGHSKNVHVQNMRFKNVTSDCVITRNESTVEIEGQDGVMEDIYIENCISDGHAESFFNHHEGSLSRAFVRNNIVRVMDGGHPDPSVSRPYGAIINIEETRYHGLIEDVYVEHNQFISDLYNWTLGQRVADGHGTDYNDSIGWALRRNEDPDFRANRIYVRDNLFKGWDRSLWHIQTQTHGGSLRFPGPSRVEYLRNRHEEFRFGVSIDDYGAPGDEVIFGDSDIFGSAPLFPGGSGVVQIIQEPPNRIF